MKIKQHFTMIGSYWYPRYNIQTSIKSFRSFRQLEFEKKRPSTKRLEAFGSKSWEPGYFTQFKGAESEKHGSQGFFLDFDTLICISKWLPISDYFFSNSITKQAKLTNKVCTSIF